MNGLQFAWAAALVAAAAGSAGAQTWTELAASATGDGVSSTAGFPNLKESLKCHVALMPTTGEPIVVSEEWVNTTPKLEIFVARWDAAAGIWESLGNVSNSLDFQSNSPRIAVTPAGIPIVVWCEEIPKAVGNGGTLEIYARQYVGGAWVPMAAGKDNVSSTLDAASAHPSLALDAQGWPVVTWEEKEKTQPIQPEIYVRAWDGSSWAERSLSGSAGGISKSFKANSTQPCIALNSSGKPVVAWSETPKDQNFTLADIFVLEWIDQASGWLPIGGSANLTGNLPPVPSQGPQLAIDSSARIFLSWHEGSSTDVAPVYLLRWDGASWTDLGGSATGNGISGPTARGSGHSLALGRRQEPVVAWTHDQDGVVQSGVDCRIHLRRWNSAAWTEIGGSASGDGASVSLVGRAATAPSLAIGQDGTMSVAYEAFTTSGVLYLSKIFLHRWLPQDWSIDALAQFRFDGVREIPPGGLVPGQDGAVLQASLTNLEGDHLDLVFEAEPVGTPLDGSGSPLATDASGQPVLALTLSGLTYDVDYHWGLSASDPYGRSLAAHFMNAPGDPNEVSQVDFRPVVNRAPGLSSLRQTEGRTTTALPAGGIFFTGEPIVFTAAVDDPDGNDVRFHIEVKPLGTPFSDFPSWITGVVPSGTVPGIPAEFSAGEYHWQARVVDDYDLESAWVAFGANPETSADFEVQKPGSAGNAVSCVQASGNGRAPWLLILLSFAAIPVCLRRAGGKRAIRQAISGLAVLTLAGGLCFAEGTDPDGNVVYPITTLSAPAATIDTTTLTLQWTVPLIYNMYGNDILDPGLYEVRYSTTPVTTSAWLGMTQANAVLPVPGATGQVQTGLIYGLTQNTGYWFRLKLVVVGAEEYSNIVHLTTAIDSTAPGAINGLAVTDASDWTVTLAWTATGDDGSTGMAIQTELRYSTAGPILSPAAFASATPVPLLPNPQVAGTSESITVQWLSPATTYWFAIRSIDEVNNKGSLAGISATTHPESPSGGKKDSCGSSTSGRNGSAGPVLVAAVLAACGLLRTLHPRS